MNPVEVGRRRLDGPVAEGRDMRPHFADLREQTGGTGTLGALDAEPESAGPAFGPCQNHLGTTDDDRHQIGRRLGKDGSRISAGHFPSPPRQIPFRPRFPTHSRPNPSSTNTPGVEPGPRTPAASIP